MQRLGEGVFWNNGDSGQHDFTTASDPAFAQLANIVTNGEDDPLNMLTWNSLHGGGGSGNSESGWGLGSPDLGGNQIDYIRLVVHDLSIQPYNLPPPFGDGLQWDANITWEFWGSPIPEPATVTLLAAGLLLSRRRPIR